MEEKRGKNYRILSLYEGLNKGEIINKKAAADKFGVDLKTIQRDIEELRLYFSENPKNAKEIIYDKREKGYKITSKGGYEFEDRDIYALSKILMEARAFTKEEMDRILHILMALCEDKKSMDKMLTSDRFNYVAPRHNKNIVDFIWKVNKSINSYREVQVRYQRQDGKIKEYNIRPLGLVFNEYYFYIIGEVVGKEENSSIVFRVDRFLEYKITNKKFLPYEGRLKEGEFNKRIQFMYTGELISIQFKFWGSSLEAILDRLPTAKIIDQYQEEGKTITVLAAEVYGEGIKRWLLSQKEFVEVIRPESYRRDMKETIKRMYDIYK